jgi:DNA-directed RNA polymerase specialized sigma24 family protein/DNA-binding beta-propeller fold protein YncE
VLYRYVYSSTGGDAALTDEVTAATFTAAARGFAGGDEDRMALGPLHDAARTALARRVRRDGLAAAARASSTVIGDDGTALHGLPYRLRIVLALQFHDHLPPDEIADALGTDEAGAERAVREASAAFLAAAGPGPRAGDGAGGGTGDERLCDLFGSLTARPGQAFAARLRDRVHEEARAVPLPVARVRAVPAGSAAAAATASATSTETGAVASPAGAAAGVAGPPRALADVARAAGPSPTAGPDAPAGTGTDPGADAPVEGLGDDDLPRTFSPARLGSASGRARVRTGLSPRVWGLPAVIATAAVLLALVVTGGGGGGGRDRAAAPPVPRADPDGGGSRSDVVDGPESRLVGATPLAPPATVGGERPAPTNTAEVVARVRVGPGGPYMNGPYALDAGAEGLWAAAVDDDGTWSAVRVDPATGETLAEIRIPGRIPSDRSDHGIAVSGGYVWTPALRDGIFRIDAATNTPSGIVAVAGGVRGAAMDGGDGAVWAVGNDNALRRFDARTTDVTATALISEMGLMPTGVDVAYGGGTVWVTVADADIRHLIGFDPLTLERRYHYLLPSLGLVSDAYELAADGDRVVVTETWPGGVTVVDGAAGQIVGQHRFATAGISVDGDRAWLLSPLDGQATVVWTRTGDLLATAGVPKGVETMVPTADGGVWAAIPSTGELVRLSFSG